MIMGFFGVHVGGQVAELARTGDVKGLETYRNEILKELGVVEKAIQTDKLNDEEPLESDIMYAERHEAYLCVTAGALTYLNARIKDDDETEYQRGLQHAVDIVNRELEFYESKLMKSEGVKLRTLSDSMIAWHKRQTASDKEVVTALTSVLLSLRAWGGEDVRNDTD
jgi:hypothetical protein